MVPVLTYLQGLLKGTPTLPGLHHMVGAMWQGARAGTISPHGSAHMYTHYLPITMIKYLMLAIISTADNTYYLDAKYTSRAHLRRW